MTIKKQIFNDVFLNIIATMIPLFVLQFIIQPFIARVVGAEIYGSILFVLGVINIAVGVFGNTLNNSRLIDNYKYYQIKGDYPIILIFFAFASSFFSIVIPQIYRISMDGFSSFFLASTTICAVVVSYLSVEFRILLKYKKILGGKIFLTIGYLLGTLLFVKFRRWEIIPFMGHGFELVYCFNTTTLWKEPFSITKNIRTTLLRIFFLVLSASMGAFFPYLDRLIIYPIFGGAELSAYYSASIIGKTIGLVIGPLGGVLLSYISHRAYIKLREFMLYSTTIITIGVVGFFSCLWISKPLIGLLYPDLLEASIPFIPFTIGSSMVGIYYTLIWPIVLRFGHNYFPLIITFLKGVTYIGFAVIFIQKYGVIGVAYASLLSSIVQAVTVFLFGIYVCRQL